MYRKMRGGKLVCKIFGLFFIIDVSMKKKDYKNYFLGLMSAEDVETIELQIISTDEIEAELLQAENNLIEDYLAGDLTKAEVKAFNANFLVTQERRARVEFVKLINCYAQNSATPPTTIKETKPNFFEQLKSSLNPQKFAFGFGGVVLILTVGFVIYLGWKNYSSNSSNSEISVLLNKTFKNDRPTEARITGFDYAPKTEGTRGNSDKTPDLNFVSAKSRAVEAVLKNETAETLHELGRVYLAEKKFDDAIEQFEKAVKQNPNLAKSHNDLGAAFMEKGKQKEEGKLELFAKANEEIETSIELDKNLAEAYFNRGLVLESLNLPNQAKEAWENYLKLDSSSQWAEEVRRHLQKLQINKPISKTKEEILRDFFEAKQANDTKKAWQTLSRNREMITGKLIPQQLAFLFVDAKINGQTAKAQEFLEALVYVGKLEEEKSGDLYWKNTAKFYTTVSDDKIPLLNEAQNSIRQGYLFSKNLQYEKAKKEFENARRIFSETGNIQEEKFCVYWLGYVFNRLKNIPKSIELLKSVESFNVLHNYKWLSGHTLCWLAINESEAGKVSKALAYYEKALAQTESVSDTYNAQKILSLIAAEYKSLKRNDVALRYLQKSLELEKSPEASQRQKWRDYEAITKTFYTFRYYKTALAFGHELLDLAFINEDTSFKGDSYLTLGVIYGSLKNYSDAISLTEKGLEMAQSLNSDDEKAVESAIANLHLGHLEKQAGNYDKALIHYDQATSFFESSDYQGNRYEARKGKLFCFLAKKDEPEFQNELPKVLELFENNRTEILEEQNRNFFFENEQSVYDIAIEYEFDKENFVAAFDYSEKSRSRSLLDLQTSTIEVTKKEKQPELKFSPIVFEPLKLAQIQVELSENVQLLEYTVLNDKVLIWLITKNSLNVAETNISSENLQNKVSTYLNLISKNIESGEQRKLAVELYQILISPIKENLDKNKETFLIPDKFLFRLPFAALYSEKYFIQEYVISYAPSANVFLISSKKAKELSRKTSETLLSIGNPTFSQVAFEYLPKLPAAHREAVEITKFYDDSIIFTEKEATKENVKENLKRADVFHFAGHYIVDENSPLLSSLVVAGNEKDDSSLANYEIIGEKLSSARLIVLSACQTTAERYYNGEGMIGVSRTFLAMGVPLIVASQWEVDSEATTKLMTEFHRYRKMEKLSTVEALRRSQLEMMQVEKFQQPYYWAAFATLGGQAKF